MTGRVLVMRGGALGDFILGLPALTALREAIPDAHLELVAPAAVLPLAAPIVDSATPLERAEMAALFADELPLESTLFERYGGLDLAVLWLADRDGSVRRNFERLGTRRVLWSPALPPQSGTHAADHLLETLRPLGISAAGPAMPLLLPGSPAREAAEGTRRRLGLASGGLWVAVHPGSGGSRKNWPPERFAAVSDRLSSLGVQAVLIQGPADGQVVREVTESVRVANAPIVAGLGVEELAALIAGCCCYLGNDSGVTHLAAAVGAPVVAIFGPTDPVVWGPRGPRVTILRTRDGWPSVEEALTAVLDITSGPDRTGGRSAS